VPDAPSDPVDPMPEPGDLIAAFSPQPGRCFRMVQSVQLQATHCRGVPEWKGVWRDRAGHSWYVEACREHAPKVTSNASKEVPGSARSRLANVRLQRTLRPARRAGRSKYARSDRADVARVNDSDPRRYFGNSRKRCSRKQAPDALPAGMCLTVPAYWDST
jgi:hypothetical protein